MGRIGIMIHTVYLPITDKPQTGIQITYVIDTNSDTYFVTDMYHSIGSYPFSVVVTNMCHMIMDIMTNPIFSGLRSAIDAKIREKA